MDYLSLQGRISMHLLAFASLLEKDRQYDRLRLEIRLYDLACEVHWSKSHPSRESWKPLVRIPLMLLVLTRCSVANRSLVEYPFMETWFKPDSLAMQSGKTSIVLSSQQHTRRRITIG